VPLRRRERESHGRRQPIEPCHAGGLTEQQVFSDLIAAQGADWVTGLRQRAHEAVDRVAWAGMRELEPQLSALKRDMAELKATAAAAARKERELSRELETVYASRSWRITAPLRRLHQILLDWRKA